MKQPKSRNYVLTFAAELSKFATLKINGPIV